jgi:hypothetical protein
LLGELPIATGCAVGDAMPAGDWAVTIGSNCFHYNPDPWGSWIEWLSDIDQIDDCWVADDWEPGAAPPARATPARSPGSSAPAAT